MEGFTTPPGEVGLIESAVAVNGAALGYIRAGRSGTTTIVLLHGWPESAHAWRYVLPLLAADFDVIAFDLPGTGRSSPRPSNFDKQSLAEDIHAALERLGVTRAVLVGHDLGAMVAYAYTRRYPDQVTGLVVVDQPLPGIEGWDAAASSVASWHLNFYRDTCDGVGVAETLIAGHEEFYFRGHIERFSVHPEAITPGDVAVYASAYGSREKLSAGLRMFRVLPIDLLHNQSETAVVDVPVVLAFGEYSYATLLESVTEGLGDVGFSRVQAICVEDCGHWVAEEKPAEIAEIITQLAETS